MEKKTSAAVLVVIIIVGIGSLVYFLQPRQTQFTFREDYPTGSTKVVSLDIENIKDCELCIDVLDDPGLLYDIEIELYTPGTPFSVELEEQASAYGIRINTDLVTPSRIKKIDILLGSGHQTDIDCGELTQEECTNVNTTVNLHNNIALSNSHKYYFIGHMDLTINEDVVIGPTGGFIAAISHHSYYGPRAGSLNCIVELAPGVNGKADFNSTSRDVTLVGWSLDIQDGDRYSYLSGAVASPLISVVAFTESVVASLLS
jgi:hypothetical protein